MTDITDDERKDVLDRLRELAAKSDFEAAHIEADGLLSDVVRRLGYHDIAAAYDAVGKWYS